jgi:hypothetical protein
MEPVAGIIYGNDSGIREILLSIRFVFRAYIG